MFATKDLAPANSRPTKTVSPAASKGVVNLAPPSTTSVPKWNISAGTAASGKGIIDSQSPRRETFKSIENIVHKFRSCNRDAIDRFQDRLP